MCCIVGEQVEYDIHEENQRRYAINVTGPNGADVVGSERPETQDRY